MFAILLVLLPLCVGQNNAASCVHRVRSCDPSNDYFPSKVRFLYSTSVKSLTYTNTYAVLEQSWTAWSGSHQQTLILVRCGCPSPNLGITGAKEIYVPISSISVHETAAVPKVYLLGQRSKLIAADSVSFATTEELLSDIENGSSLDIQGNFTRLFPDHVPDVLLTGSGTFSAASQFSNFPILATRRVLDADAGERSPLGRAELIKQVGLLFGAEDTANAVFGDVEANYNRSKERALRARRRPSVMLNGWTTFFGGNWSITKGSSYIGQFLRDANCEYANERDTLPSSMNIASFRAVFERSDYWLNAAVFGSRTTMDRILRGNSSRTAQGDRPVLVRFDAVRCREVYAEDNMVTSQGNPFFELGVIRPDLILDDLVNILHPDVSDGAPLNFYQRVAAPTDGSDIEACPRTYFARRPATGRVFVESTFNLTGISSHDFLRQVHAGLKERIASYLSVAPSDLELVVAAFPLPTLDMFTVSVRALHPECAQVSRDCGIIPLGRRLQAINATLEAALRDLAGSQNVNAVQASKVVVRDSSDNVVPLTVVEETQPALSAGAIAGIVIGVTVGVSILVAGIALLVHRSSFRKGEAYAYSLIGGKPPAATEQRSDI